MSHEGACKINDVFIALFVYLHCISSGPLEVLICEQQRFDTRRNQPD